MMPKRTGSRGTARTSGFASPFGRERIRIAVVFGFLCLTFAFVGCNLVRVHLNPEEERLRRMEHYRRELPARRGPILDRDGNPLAVSVPRWKLWLDSEALEERWRPRNKPADTNALEHVCTNLLAFGLCPPEKLRGTISDAIQRKGRRNKLLAITEDPAVIDAIERDALLRGCISREKLSRREQLAGRDFVHLIGFVNNSGEAQNGIEKRFDAELRAKPGRIVGERASRGRELRDRRIECVEPENGYSVVLTVDQTLQRIVCGILDDVMDQYDPDAAWAIVEDVATGEILAMVSRPDFDPDDYYRLAQEDSPRLWNSALFQNYEPGSVMKSLVTAAALEEGLVATNTVLDVSDTLYCGRRLSDHKGMADRITVAELLKFSSNRGASRLAMLLGKERTERWFRAFGLGDRTGIQLPESAGILAPHRKWSDLQGIRVAIGQGVSVTGIQLVNAYACLANGGRLLRPSIVKRIVAGDGTTVWRHEPEEIGRPVSEKVSRDMTAMLTQVTKPGGTARRAAVPGYEVAGKTGTAQLVVDGKYSTTAYCASFCGYFPARDPAVAILVTVKHPRKTVRNPNRLHTGGSVAGPVFASIATAVADRFSIPTDDEIGAPPETPFDGPDADEPDIPFEDLPADEID